MRGETFEGEPCGKCGNTTRHKEKRARCVYCRRQYNNSRLRLTETSRKEYYQRNKDEIAKRNKEYYDSNRETKLKQKKEYYVENKENINLKSKLYAEEHKEILAKKNKIWREGNKEKLRKKQKEYVSHNRQAINARCMKRHCAKLKRTPTWSNLEDIKQFYMNCPEGKVVDHIIPLQGKIVSGFHVVENLQYLTPSENSSKSNKFEPQFIINGKQYNS